MKISTRTLIGTAAFAIGCANLTMLNAAPATKSEATNDIRSVFTLPSNPAQGRDPFFPESIRPYESAMPTNPKAADVSSLVLKGFSGSLDRRLVIINNHTFAAGDDGDVVTSAGRIHLRCVEINTDSVVIEVNGQYHKLFYEP